MCYEDLLPGAGQVDLGLSRLRANALVGQGAGTTAFSVCSHGGGRSSIAPRGSHGDRAGGSKIEWGGTPQGADSRVGFSVARENIGKFVEAYRQYCWSVASLDDLKLAPFHLLATEGHVHTDKNHVWHMDTLARVCRGDSQLLLATPFEVIAVTDADSLARGIEWWTELTASGGEGIVVKPHEFIFKGRKGLTQPALKCRRREYLRIHLWR